MSRRLFVCSFFRQIWPLAADAGHARLRVFPFAISVSLDSETPFCLHATAEFDRFKRSRRGPRGGKVSRLGKSAPFFLLDFFLFLFFFFFAKASSSRPGFFSTFFSSTPTKKKHHHHQHHKKNSSVEQDKAFELALAEFWSCPDRDASVAAKLGAAVAGHGGGGIAKVRSRLALLEVRERGEREKRILLRFLF